ncbi:MAG TPA: hypothetical protein VKA50_06565, partial [Gammaproteobacteria bacterium]|nr:hypothetical protein [Gammaproteobacteria bacterium]
LIKGIPPERCVSISKTCFDLLASFFFFQNIVLDPPKHFSYGFLPSNGRVQARRRVSADVAWNPLLDAL